MQTLKNPITRFELVPALAGPEETTSVIGHVQSERQLWLNQKLLAFALLSIVLGLMINALIPDRKQGPELLPSVVIIFVYWIASGSFMHLTCWLLQGKGKYLETLSVIIQVFATLYVVTSFSSFLGVLLLMLPPVTNIVEKIPAIGPIFIGKPVFVFFLIGTFLSIICVPLSMKSVHKFGWLRTLIIAIIPLLTVWISVAVYLRYGLLTMSIMKPPSLPNL